MKEELAVCRLIIVDDNPSFRRSVEFMTQHTPYVELVGDFEKGNEALESIPLLKPDIILVDAFMPSMNGITLTRLIRQQFPTVKIIAFTASIDNWVIEGLLKAGASQVVSKDNFVAGLIDAIPQLKVTA